jgi:hypothetical protein
LNKNNLIFGAIIAKCTLIDIVTDSKNEWALSNHYHWLLTDIERINPIFVNGKQGIWRHFV